MHSRAGQRTSAETARVRQLLRALNAGGQHVEEFDQLTAGVCRIWASRYTPTATELVLPDTEELSSLLHWCKVIGLPNQYIEVRVPEDSEPSAELRRIAEEHGLPAEAIRATTGCGLSRIAFVASAASA